jgi:hypothetical protein
VTSEAMATTVLKMPPAVPAASSTNASEIFIRSKDDALPGGAGPCRHVIRIAPLAFRYGMAPGLG